MKITIPAAVGGVPGSLNLSVSGKFFLVAALDNPFRVRFKERDYPMQNVGDNFGDVTGPTFTILAVYNDGPVAVNADVLTGNEKISFSSTAISTTVATALTNTLAACTEAIPGQFAITNPNNATRVAFAAAGNYFRHATVTAQRDLAGTPNVGVVRFGVSNGANLQPVLLNPGDQQVIDAPVGCKYDFAKWFLAVATNGDGVAIIFS